MIKLQLHPSPKMLGQFAWVASLGFAFIAVALHRLFGLPTIAAWLVAAIGPLTLVAHLVGTVAVPRLVWRTLVVATYPLGLVLFPLLLGLVYYGVFTPMGLLFRAIGRDSMHRGLDRSQRTYWQERGAPRPSGSYFHLY